MPADSSRIPLQQTTLEHPCHSNPIHYEVQLVVVWRLVAAVERDAVETHLIMKGVVLVGGGLAIEGVGVGIADVHRYQTTMNTVCKCLYNNQYVYNHSTAYFKYGDLFTASCQW